jgi:hypothetical protein
MPNFPYKDLTDVLFADAEAIIAELDQEHGGEFTSQQFLRVVAQRNQATYVALLARSAEADPHWAFNNAHQAIGRELSREASKLGYTHTDEGRHEVDIFGNPTDKIVYRKEE